MTEPGPLVRTEDCDTGVLQPGHQVETWQDLCLLLRGDETSYTGQLLRLIQKADPRNRSLLRRVYPREVYAWEIWTRGDGQLTALEIAVLLRMRDLTVYCGGGLSDIGSHHAPHRWVGDDRWCPGEPT